MSAIHDLGRGWHFIQRGWLNGNHLAYQGGQTVLIDSAYLGGIDETLDLLGQIGIQPRDVDLILTTHVHCDHVGAHYHIQKASGCTIALHQESRRIIDSRNGRSTWHEYYGQDYRYFPTHKSIADGEVIDLGGESLVAIHAPGHAAGQVCFFMPSNGWLISADAAWDGDFGVLTTGVEGRQAALEQKETLLRLAKLPITKILPGHGSLIDNPGRAIERCLKRVEGFIQNPLRMAQDQMKKILLYQLMMRGPLAGDGLWELVSKQPWFGETCRDYFNDPSEQVFLSHLQELRDKGLIKETPQGLAAGMEA